MLMGIGYWVFYKSKEKTFPELIYRPLFLWHLLITGLALYFNFYQGKEIFRYWQPIIYSYDVWNDWLAHWGYNSYFIEFLNYFPGRIFGLHFIVGSLAYAMLSFLAFVLVAKSLEPVYRELDRSNNWVAWIFCLIFFLPSIHFWSSMPSKESLIWFGLGLGTYGFQKSKWLLFILGMMVLIFIRPVLGFIVGFGFWVYFIMYQKTLGYVKIVVSIFILILGDRLLEMIKIMMGVESLTWLSIQEFSINQYEFLSQFDSRGNLKMNDLNIIEKWFAVIFRPGFWEIESIWQAAAAAENFLIFLFLPGAIGLILFAKSGRYSKEFLFIVVLSLIYCLIIGISSYNLGIFARLKSSVLLGMIFSSFYGWFLIFQKFKTVYLKSGKGSNMNFE
jgi:hypothetical protein